MAVNETEFFRFKARADLRAERQDLRAGDPIETGCRTEAASVDGLPAAEASVSPGVSADAVSESRTPHETPAEAGRVRA